MATTAASAASSDSNRSIYARSLDSGNDVKGFRLNDVTLSAFDLLLELPVFQNTIAPAKAESKNTPVAESSSDDPKSDEEDSNVDAADTNVGQIPLPITNRLEKTLKQQPKGADNSGRQVDADQVRAIKKTAPKDSPRAQVPVKPNEVQPNQTEQFQSTQSIDELPTDSLIASDVSLSPSKVGEQAFASPTFDRNLPNDADRSKVTPDNEVSSADRKKKVTDERTTDVRPAADRNRSSVPVEKPAIAKSVAKQSSPESESETNSLKRTDGNEPFANRRSERLAEAKRGERSASDSHERDGESADGTDLQGGIDIPKDLELSSETITSNQAVSQPDLSLSNLFSDPNAIQNVDSTPTITPSSPILSTGVLSATTPSTSVTGLDSDNSSAVSGVSGVSGAQGSTTLSESTAARSTATLPGRTSTLSKYQETRVLQRVLKGLSQLDDGGGQVRLRLHPPELGSLQVTLRMDAQQVSALIEVEHPAAREVLLTNLPQLQSQLAEQGLSVSSFDVQVVDQNQWSGQGWESGNGRGAGQNDADNNRSSRYLDRLRNQIDRPTAAATASPTQLLWSRRNGELDLRF